MLLAGGLSTVRPAPLWLFSEFGAVYKYSDLLTYLLTGHDKNGNFHKFKIADGRHFKTSFISISQQWIIRFRSSLVICWCIFSFRGRTFDKKIWFFFKFKMADGHHIENCSLAISRRHIGRFMQVSEWIWRITCIYQLLDQNGNFRKFRMADGRHFW